MLTWRINAYYCLLFSTCPYWSHISLDVVKFNAADLVEVSHSVCGLSCIGFELADIDVVYDTSSVYLRVSKELKAFGIKFASVAKALLIWASRIRRYMGSVVSHNDNYFGMLNSCLFTDGTYINVGAGARCPANLSTYFRISSSCAAQLERTLIIIDRGGSATYFEGCNATKLNKNTLHVAVVELAINHFASLKYTTVQNWYTSDRFGVYNLVTKRALCFGVSSRIAWVQVEIGASATWKYPSSVLLGTNSTSEFYSLSVGNRSQLIDTGTKVLHLARKTASVIFAKSVLFGRCDSSFRALVSLSAGDCRNYTRCDALIVSDACANRTMPIIVVGSCPVTLEYETLSSYVTASQLRYCEQRGIDEASAFKLIVTGYTHEIIRQLPLQASLEVAKALFNY
ncbi:MAG: SufD family Fe-S cluster assembly protein [Candidatus Hodgkinia cicadicola]